MRIIVPAFVAQRLKRHEFVADNVESASVLFANLTNFTSVAGTAKAADLVQRLDRVFTRFDALAEKMRRGENQNHRRRLSGRKRPSERLGGSCPLTGAHGA